MGRIFDKSQRLPVPIHQIGDPQQRYQYHDENWGSETYYADYAGLAYLCRPKYILEMGVFLGYSACAMILGAQRAGVDVPWYIGIDAELVKEGSNEIAYTNINKLCDGKNIKNIVKFHLVDQLPLALFNSGSKGRFDLINVDADHQADGTYQTLRMAWDVLAPGGTLILDDTHSPLVQEGLRRFLFRHGEETIRFQWYENETGWALLQKDR